MRVAGPANKAPKVSQYSSTDIDLLLTRFIECQPSEVLFPAAVDFLASGVLSEGSLRREQDHHFKTWDWVCNLQACVSDSYE